MRSSSKQAELGLGHAYDIVQEIKRVFSSTLPRVVVRTEKVGILRWEVNANWLG